MRLLAAGLAVVAFALPFALFGGRIWASLVLFSAAFAAAAAALAIVAVRGRFHRGVLALGAVPVLVGLLQLVPLPAGLVGALSPVRAELQAALPVEDLEAWSSVPDRRISLADLLAEETAAPAGETAPRAVAAHPLSFDPAGTLVATGAVAATLLLLAAAAGQRDERFGLVAIGACLVLVAAGAVYGLWNARAGLPLYGVFEPPPFDHHRPYGTFWNLNHFAGLCALACPVLLGAALDAGRSRLLRLAAFLLLAPPALAVLDAGSRGALLAGGVGAALLGLALLRDPGRKLVGVALAGGAVLALLLAFTLFSERLIDESFDETTAIGHDSNRLRLELYQRQLRMIGSAPLAGHGLGAFHDAHGPYKETAESVVPHHGESDWLETAVEGGVPVWLAWIGMIAWLWWEPLRCVLAGRAPPLLAGLLAGSAATIAHAAVDYHHREPSIAVVSVLLAGTACAWARNLSGREAGERVLLDRVLVFGALALALLLMMPVRDALRHDLGREGALRALERGNPVEALEPAQRAAEAWPADGSPWAVLALVNEKIADGLRGEARKEHHRAALAANAEALQRSPATLGAARQAGALLLQLGADQEALRAAQLAVKAAPGHSAARQLLGEVYLLQDRTEEALPELARAYNGVPVFRLAEQAPQHSRLLGEASYGDATRVLELVPGSHHRVWYLSELGRAGRSAELPAAFAWLAENPPAPPVRGFVGVLGRAPGPEASALAELLEPQIDETQGRVLLARAWLGGGRAERGAELLDELLALPDAPGEAFLALADHELGAGRRERARELVAEGLRRHPGHPGLRGRSRQLAEPAP